MEKFGEKNDFYFDLRSLNRIFVSQKDEKPKKVKMKHKPIFVAVAMLLGACCLTNAQNPVIRSLYTADPTARVFNGKVYLYPSHDIMPPDGQRQDWFCMEDYHVFSSENLTDWTDHGVIVSQEKVPWGKPDGYSMWAPDCVEKGGKYYFYFPNGPKTGRGFAIGVAVSDSPEGPFTIEPEPIKDVMGIDPCVLLDDDGQQYIYWAGGPMRGARLKNNMKELDGPVTMMEGLPEGFKEGPFAFKRNGLYYLTFPWVRQEGGTETLAYATSNSPLGPWDFKGIIMAEHANRCWTNHHSLVEYKGQWYLFYHTNFFSPKDDKRRSVCIEKLTFNTDGTIQEVKETMRGVGINQATERIEIDRYSSSKDASVAYVDTTNTMLGACVTLSAGGSWVKYDGVDFSNIADGYLVINVMAHENTRLCVREKSVKGKVIAKVDVTVKSEQGAFRRDMSGQRLTLTAPLEYTPKGITDLVVSCEGEAVSMDWLRFKNRPKYFTEVGKKDAPSQPDYQGFIRRWRLMEPIAVDVRSNIIFTNSWLREKFSEELARLTKQKAKWYTLDSENYNMKLFRFAEKYGKQTYGSYFWCETIIDCSADIEKVRLACGSNGASMWWLNGEEVLLLEGDRRMVEDDGMSQRLTLKKGRNILRAAVINGPGLSDMCARFLDEKGLPVTNFTLVNE